MKTIVKHVGSGGVWEGPIENYSAHKDVIEYWCEGGDIQLVLIGGAGNGEDYYRDVTGPEFPHDLVFRIKQREPKKGEVWLIMNECYQPVVFIYSNDKNCLRAHWLDGSVLSNSGAAWTDMKYAAPSVEAYYARKFWNKVYGNEGILNQTMADEAAYKMSDIVEEAAQLEKQQCNPGK